jgi:hypothetical protein
MMVVVPGKRKFIAWLKVIDVVAYGSHPYEGNNRKREMLIRGW